LRAASSTFAVYIFFKKGAAMKLSSVGCVAFSLFSLGVIHAAELNSALAAKLAAAKADQRFAVIAKLYGPRNIQTLDRELHSRKAPLAERHRLVIRALRANAAETQGPVLKRLETMKAEGRVEGYTAYWIDNLIVFAGTADAVLEIATDPSVESIGQNFKAQLIEPVARGPLRTHHPSHLDQETVLRGQVATGATRINRELGLTGLGCVIGGCDSGVDGTHPALASRWRGNFAPHAECWHDVLQGGDQIPYDWWGHGTHTMGTMCGRAITGTDTLTIGAAPDARWIACNPLRQHESDPQLIQDVLDAYQWFADPDGNENTMEDVPDVVHNSWGDYDGDCMTNWNDAIVNCEAAGPVVTWSAGNSGPTPNSLRPPARFALNATQMFSVGAVDLSVDSIPPYPIATFSSRGPSGCQPNPDSIKPEIVAPGVNVYSSYPGGQYVEASGTSMAGPHVAGIVALMRQACPNCDAQTIKEALLNTAIDEGYPPAGDDNTFGRGMIDGYNAVLAVYSLGRLDGYVTLPNGDPIPGARIQALGVNRSVLTDDAGHYELFVAAGTYTIFCSKFGYQAATEYNVAVTDGDTTHLDAVLTVSPAGILAGIVIVQSGFPVAGARVNFLNTPLDTMVSNADGRFALDIPASSYQTRVQLTIPVTPPRVFTTDTIITVNTGDTTRVVLTVTADIADPSPADAYGYRAYDRYDRDLPCPYDWVELDPASGGHGGIPFTYAHPDSGRFFQAPFPIIFYGWQAESLTVNCNGWMLPGVHPDAGAVDTPIPSNNPMTPDPPGIIAPLWNNFDNPPGALQFSLYDSVAGRWIFEFVNQRLVSPSNYLNNWEVQFLDPAFYPTATGDCEVHFLYGVVRYGTAGTVGIENPAEDTGIQVQHDSLSHWSWPVENGGAIRFTTGHVTEYGNATIVLGLNPPPPSGTPLTLHVGGRRISTTYPNALLADSVPAAPVSAVLYLPGYEMARVEQVTIHAGEMNTLIIDAWRLDTVRELSASQNNGVVTLRWRRPESAEFQMSGSIGYRVYRNDTLRAAMLADTVFADDPLPQGYAASYAVDVHYGFGHVLSRPLAITIDLPAEVEQGALPTVYRLHPAYPNPFNPETRIRFDLPMNTSGRLEVYDLQGRLVCTLWSGTLAAGRYEYNWKSNDSRGLRVSSGLYFCRFSSPEYTTTQKLMLVR
jgi:subtilisin family serine protease